MKRVIASMIIIMALGCGSAFSATPGAVPDKPNRIIDRNTPVAVDYDGTDSIGARLNTRIKELLNGSNLFSFAEEKNIPKIRLLISTVSEFASRPSIGSAYSAVWVFSLKDGNLPNLVQHEVGIVDDSNINEIASKIVDSTDRLAIRYSYLLKPEQENDSEQ